MTATRTRTRRQSIETVVVKIPPSGNAAVWRHAEPVYTTPRGYIERRLSEWR
jgi:hypothetical protein